MKKTRANWQAVTGRVQRIEKTFPDLDIEATDYPDVPQEKRRYDMELKQYIAEASIPELVEKANTPAGTEERKRLKKLSEFRVKPVTFDSIDYSNRDWRKSPKNPVRGDMGGVTCTPSAKTDIKVNSYYSAKGRIPK